MILFGFTTPGCKRDQGGRAVWEGTCSRCHELGELSGRTAADIRSAIETIPTMGSLKGRLSDRDLRELEALLAGKLPAKEQAPPAYRHQVTDMCRPCHKRQVAQWRETLHAKAHGEAVYDRYFIKASMESGQKLETFCARCHTPLGVFRGEIPFGAPPRRPGDTRVSEVAREGVQCDFCHTISGYDRLENGGYRIEAVRVMRGPLRGARSPMHGTAHEALFRKAELCGTCHNVSHPGCGIVLESTYTEWRESAYAREGVVCQDCHMTAGLTRRLARPGRAAHGGPERRHVSDHTFVGPNVIFASDATAEGRELRRRSLELMRRAARIEIGDPARERGRVVLPIRVANVGAGHSLPTGVTELREMWLELRVKDDRGRTLHESGRLDGQGNLEPDTIVYRTDVYDKAGKRTTRFWNTASKGRDHRVPARGSITEKIDLGELSAGQLSVEVLLRYRSVTPAGLQEVGAPRNLVKIPTITMATASRTIKL